MLQTMRFPRFLAVLAFALSATLSAQNLSNVSVDQMSDAQIQQIVNRGKAQGLNESDAEAMASSMGLAPEEAAKFKDRVAKLGTSTKSVAEQTSPEAATKTPATRMAKTKEITDSSDVFGMDFFKRADFKPYTQGNEVVQAPASYLIGPGDELSVTVYGTALVSKTLKVDARGFIEFSGLWRLNVAGMTFAQAEDAITKRLAANFNLASNQVHLALNFARSISVNVAGEVQKPGTYTLPATNSAFNFIAAAGGPTEAGSMRRVRVVRGGKTVQTLDLYSYLTQPGSATLIYTQDGDHLVIEPVGPRSKVEGAVRRPMTYEVILGESVQNLISYAGGFTEQANTVTVQLRRPAGNQLNLVDVPVAKAASTEVQPGDRLTVTALNEALTDYVEVYGAVRYPGRYAYTQGLSATQLISLAGGYSDKALQTQGYILRERADRSRTKVFVNPTQAALSNRDQLYVLENPDLGEGLAVAVSGSVRQPVNVAYAEGLTLGDVLRMAGGAKIDADLSRVEVSRVNTEATRKRRAELFTIDVPADFAKNPEIQAEALNFALQPYDQVVLRQKPNYSMQKLVYVGGEVKYPGYYALGSYDERLSSLLIRAGGATNFADLSNTQLYREKAPNVVVELRKAILSPKGKFNYILAEGDSLLIPEFDNLVQITGDGHRTAEYGDRDTLSAPFVGDMRADRYVKQYALGFAKRADREGLYVKYPNGKFSRTHNYGLFKVYPVVKAGGEIAVTLKPEKVKTTKNGVKFDVNQAIGTVTAALTSFATIYVLLTR
jgi:protein involved in polysaccharide export with SLBB domain